MLKNFLENSIGKTVSDFSSETKSLCLEAAKKEIKFYYSLANVDIVMENFQRNNEGTGDMRSLYLKSTMFYLIKYLSKSYIQIMDWFGQEKLLRWNFKSPILSKM